LCLSARHYDVTTTSHRDASVKNFGLRDLVMTTSNISYHPAPTRWVMPLSLLQANR